jgi:hypothetical protein
VCDLLKRFCDGCVVRNVAFVGFGVTARRDNLLPDSLGGVAIHVQNTNTSAGSRECLGDGLTDAAAASGNDSRFPIESEGLLRRRRGQSETPRFQGMKSSCASSSARVCTSPPAI